MAPDVGALILVVEDNRANLQLAQALLRRAGYRVAEACSLLQARQVLKAQRPDLVLLDLGLPDGNGLELLPDLGGTPALAVSAYAMTEDRTRALAAGCVGFVTKPLNTRTFATEVTGALVRTAQRGEGDTTVGPRAPH